MTTIHAMPARFDDSASGWERALDSFLAEKERRSGSRRTVQSYSRMLQDFFGRLGEPPDQVTSQGVFAYAHGIGLPGREPSAVTVGARAAGISSFYRFLIRMDAVTSNPCDALERPKAGPAPPRGLSAEQVRQLLAVIPETRARLRDRAIILTLVLTGRRRSEVLNLTAGDLALDGDAVFYEYRGKGGKRGRRELPRPAYDAIVRALAAFGKDIARRGRTNPCGGLSARTAGSRMGPRTCASDAISGTPLFRLRGCTCFGTPPRSCGAKLVNRSRRSARFSTTAHSRSRPPTCEGSKGRKIRDGQRWPRRSALGRDDLLSGRSSR